MASLKFYLKNSSGGETSIFFRFYYGAYELINGKKKYLPLQYSTIETINPKFWDKKNGRAKESKTFPQYPEFNQRLRNVDTAANDVLRRLQNDGITPTNDILKQEFDRLWRKEKDQTAVQPTMELMAFIDHFIQTSPYKYGTVKVYKQTYRNLQEYQKAKNIRLTFAKIDIDFYNDWVQWMRNTKHYAENTVGRDVARLKTFLRAAKDANYPVTDDFTKKAFRVIEDPTDAIYLTEAEQAKMYQVNLSGKPRLERVRDLFLIGCNTGLRFSDLSTLSKDNFNADNTITIRTIKTDTDVVIPMRSMVTAIMEKYAYQLPKVPSNQKFNEYVKEVAKMAGVDDTVVMERTKGGMRVKQTFRKYELTTTHTARRSFATNAYLADVPSISIMKITGHQTEAAFMQYIKISAKENAIKLQSHKFFNQPLMVVNE